MVDIFVDIFTSIVMAYAALGVVYVLRLSWDSITARFSGLFAILAVWLLWPFVLWSEVGHEVRERARARRIIRINNQEYLAAVARLTAERRARERAK